MITFLLFLILIVAICFMLAQFKKTGWVFLVIFFIGFLLIGCGILPSILAKCSEPNFSTFNQIQWKNKNAIVLLGASNVTLPKTQHIRPGFMGYSRIVTAAQLYFSCKRTSHNCVLIPSGGDPQHMGMTEAEILRNELLGVGVDDFDIELEKNSHNTYQNAKFTSAILKTGNYDNVVLVTSGIHLARALLYFRSFGINSMGIPSDFTGPILSFIPLGYNFAIADFNMHELAGILRLHIYNYLGWNKN